MTHRYRTGTKLQDGKIVVRNIHAPIVDGVREVKDRGLRIKYSNHVIDLDKQAMRENWTPRDLKQAVAKMEYLVENAPRGRGRGYYRDNPVTSVDLLKAEQNIELGCRAFGANEDGTQWVCGASVVPGSEHCDQHTVKEGAAVAAPPEKVKASK